MGVILSQQYIQALYVLNVWQIYSALSQGITKIKSIAIVSKTFAKPCGSCRQIIHEYLGNIPIYISDSKGQKYETHYINELLPYPFDIEVPNK